LASDRHATREAAASAAVDPKAQQLRDDLCRRVAAGELRPDLTSSATAVASDLPQVEGYRLLGLVAAGGMGMVYAATAAATGHKVAIKVVRRDRQGAAATERIQREVRALSAIAHPGIVGYLDHGSTSTGAPYLVTEWLEGVDLENRLLDGPLPVEDALALGIALADALAAAHEHGVVHRDVKPANIFLVDGRPDQARLLDFGIVMFQADMPTLTQPGAILGTPAYMSPEQAYGDEQIDHRTDLFSLGCVLHECLCGQPTFGGEHVMAVLGRVLVEEPRRVSELRPGVSRDLDEIVAQLLEKEPRQRLASARELAARPRALATGEPAASSPLLPHQPPPPPPPPRPRPSPTKSRYSTRSSSCGAAPTWRAWPPSPSSSAAATCSSWTARTSSTRAATACPSTRPLRPPAARWRCAPRRRTCRSRSCRVAGWSPGAR
jgi:serine/threonine protein kinase